MLVMPRTALVLLLGLCTIVAAPRAALIAQQSPSTADPFHRTLDQILTTLMQPLTIVWMLVVTLVIVALITRLGAGRKKLDPLRDPTPLQSLSRGVFDRSEAGRFRS